VILSHPQTGLNSLVQGPSLIKFSSIHDVFLRELSAQEKEIIKIIKMILSNFFIWLIYMF